MVLLGEALALVAVLRLFRNAEVKIMDMAMMATVNRGKSKSEKSRLDLVDIWFTHLL